MFEFFRSSPKLPASFDRWSEVEVLVSSEHLYHGPSIGKIQTSDQWRDTYKRWRTGYDVFLKAGTLPDAMIFDRDLDRRQYEHYAALLLQSGQWHAILLMLAEQIADVDRAQFVAEMDTILADLRRRIADC